MQWSAGASLITPVESVQGSPEPPFEVPDGPAGRFAINVRDWLRDLALSLFIAGVVIVFLYQPVRVEGTSMLPRLADEQRIFVNKFIYRIDRIERGDVVVFKLSADPTRSYIKRVIGLPGESVEIRSGAVFVDGRPLSEDYIPDYYRDLASHAPVRVPEDEYFVLGDHRNTSKDSRVWGTVDAASITGKAVFAYWPPERFGTVR